MLLKAARVDVIGGCRLTPVCLISLRGPVHNIQPCAISLLHESGSSKMSQLDTATGRKQVPRQVYFLMRTQMSNIPCLRVEATRAERSVRRTSVPLKNLLCSFEVCVTFLSRCYTTLFNRSPFLHLKHGSPWHFHCSDLFHFLSCFGNSRPSCSDSLCTYPGDMSSIAAGPTSHQR